MALTITGGLGQAPRRIGVYGQQHMQMANDMVDRIVKVVRGNTPLPPFGRRQLSPISRRAAMRMAARQLPYLPESDVLEIYKIAKL